MHGNLNMLAYYALNLISLKFKNIQRMQYGCNYTRFDKLVWRILE